MMQHSVVRRMHEANGLLAQVWGEGDGSLLNWSEDARWLVVEVVADSVVDLGGKVKFPSGTVVFCGDSHDAAAYVSEHGGAGRAIVRGTATAGDWGTATAGDGGTATAGDGGALVIRHWLNGRYRDRDGRHHLCVSPDCTCSCNHTDRR